MRLFNVELARETQSLLDELLNKYVEEHGELVGRMLFTMALKNHGEMDMHHIDKIRNYEHYIFEKAAPFKKGDLVELALEIDFDEAYGWRSSQCFLQPGAKGEVAEIRVAGPASRIDFFVGVRWFNQTWVDTSGEERPVDEDRWAIYTHPCDYLRKLPVNLSRQTALASF